MYLTPTPPRTPTCGWRTHYSTPAGLGTRTDTRRSSRLWPNVSPPRRSFRFRILVRFFFLAQFLLGNATDAADYAAVRREVRKLGLDPDKVHTIVRRPRERSRLCSTRDGNALRRDYLGSIGDRGLLSPPRLRTLWQDAEAPVI